MRHDDSPSARATRLRPPGHARSSPRDTRRREAAAEPDDRRSPKPTSPTPSERPTTRGRRRTIDEPTTRRADGRRSCSGSRPRSPNLDDARCSAGWRRCASRAGSRSRSSSTCRRRRCTSATRSSRSLRRKIADREPGPTARRRVRAQPKQANDETIAALGDRSEDPTARGHARRCCPASSRTRACRLVALMLASVRGKRRAVPGRCVAALLDDDERFALPDVAEIPIDGAPSRGPASSTFTRDADDPAQAAKRAAAQGGQGSQARSRGRRRRQRRRPGRAARGAAPREAAARRQS